MKPQSERETITIEPIRLASRMERNFNNRIFASTDLTDTLQLRAIYKDHYGKYATEFVCGLDIFTLQSGSSIVVSTCGIWGRNFSRFVKRYLDNIHWRIIGDEIPENTIGFYICDDSENIERDCRGLTNDEIQKFCAGINTTSEDETLQQMLDKHQIQEFLTLNSKL